MRSEKTVCAPLRLSDVSPLLALKQFQCSSDWLTFKEDRLALQSLFPRLSPPSDRWCDVLGFVPTGRVSSSSTLQIFQDANHLWLLCLPVYLLGRLPSLRYALGSTPTGVLKMDVDHWHSPVSASHSIFTFCSKLIESMRMVACVAWLSPLVAIQRRAWVTATTSIVKLEVETVGCTVFMDGGRTLLDSEAPSWLVFGDWAGSDCKIRLLPKIFILEYRTWIS